MTLVKTMNYNPTSWRVPYDQLILKDPKQVLVSSSLQVLLLLLTYPIPEDGTGGTPKDLFRVFLGRLHRPQDFEFLVGGLIRFLSQPVSIQHRVFCYRALTSRQVLAASAYIPGTQQAHRWAPEFIMLFWEALQCNKRFRSFIIGSDNGHRFLIIVLYYALEYKNDPNKQGVVRMCAFVLQTLSTETDFGKRLQEPYQNQTALSASVRIEGFEGTYADYTIIVSTHSIPINTQHC